MADPTPASPDPRPQGPIVLSTAEFLWLTLGIWLGGIFILTLMPILLIPRLGMPLGIAGAYLLFFIAWQPIQIVTQRTVGMTRGVVRMIMFVGSAATIAFYLRAALLSLGQ